MHFARYAGPRVDRRQVLAAALAGAAGALLPAAAAAQAYPAQPIRIVVPFGAGGIADLTARAVAQKMGEGLKQGVIVDNKPGAGGVVAGEAVAKAAPDGYTLLLMSNATAVSAGLFKSLPFDAQEDFAPIVTIGFFDIAVFAGGERPLPLDARHARVRESPSGPAERRHDQHGQLAAPVGRTAQDQRGRGLPGRAVQRLAGGAHRVARRAGGRGRGNSRADDGAGFLRGRAGARGDGRRRAPGLADVPTVAESGVAGFDVSSWNALAAPARTPAPVIALLNREANRALAHPALRRQFEELGVAPAGGTPEHLRELLASETRRWGDVIKRANVPRQ